MAYDCLDGWCDIIKALRLDLHGEGVDADDAQEVATLALHRIAELQRTEAAARTMLAALKAACADLKTDRFTAGMIADDLAAAIAAAEAAGINGE